MVKQEDKLGATYLTGRLCRFCVWAPMVEKVEVHIVSPEERLLPLEKDDRGYHTATLAGVKPGDRYYYRLDGAREYPDPASRFQPEGVHKASQVVDPSFTWSDVSWRGLPLRDYVIYELHTGAFTPEGTFEAVIPHLDGLKELGVTAVELMPVAQFPGARNWGYDGVYPFAVQNSYGGPAGLKKLVDACHGRGLAVVLDVVYNHLGPEGNYLEQFGPYFTDRYKTPWGQALNFDGAESDEVRRFFIENARQWLNEFHIDALRLDALHAILDISPQTFIEDLAVSDREFAGRPSRRVYLIGESDANDRKLIIPREEGGYGLDAQWDDDFHHALHVLLTGEQAGYYQDFGKVEHLAKAYREGFVYSGQTSAFRRRRHGSSSKELPAERFVVFAQDHDQVGNRMLGERLSQLVTLDGLKLAAGAVLLSPYVPLLFMGEEYGETAPFQYFTSHADEPLIESVRNGRRAEFAAFEWQGEVPDPQDEAVFQAARLDHQKRFEEPHRTLLELYKELLRLRREIPALACLSKEKLEVTANEKNRTLALRRWDGESQAVAAFNFGESPAKAVLPVPGPGRWRLRLDSAAKRWLGDGGALPEELEAGGELSIALEPRSFSLFTLERGA